MTRFLVKGIDIQQKLRKREINQIYDGLKMRKPSVEFQTRRITTRYGVRHYQSFENIEINKN